MHGGNHKEASVQTEALVVSDRLDAVFAAIVVRRGLVAKEDLSSVEERPLSSFLVTDRNSRLKPGSWEGLRSLRWGVGKGGCWRGKREEGESRRTEAEVTVLNRFRLTREAVAG